MNKIVPLFNLSWLRWTLFTTVGSGLGFLFQNILPLDPDRYYSHYLAVFAVIGLFTSLGQWIILRRHLKHAWLWIPATTLGFTLAHDSVILLSYNVWAMIYPISVGLFVGILQSVVARRRIRNSLIWTLISTLSWGLAYNFVFDYLFMELIDVAFGFILGAIIGLVIGAIGGFFVEPLLVKPIVIDMLISQREAS